MAIDTTLEGLKDLLEKEIRKVTKKDDITPAELENMTKALCLLEKIKEIEHMQGGQERGYSMEHDEHSRRAYPVTHDGNSYGGMVPAVDGVTYRGRPMVDTGRSYGTEHHGYSGHSIRDRMVAKLEEMYDQAGTEHERQVVDDWIRRLSGR